MIISFEINSSLSNTANLFLLGTFIREEISNNEVIELVIPKSVFTTISMHDFNQYFSDFLIESGFHESRINIKIQDLNYFQLIIGNQP
jgi:hypothetical protein